MNNLINASIKNHSTNLAYIYYDNNNVSYSQTYHELKQESEQIKQMFSDVPKGALVGVQLGKKPCLLPVIYCLLECKIAFLLLDENEPYHDYVNNNVVLYALITCNTHRNENTALLHKNHVYTTKQGCSFNFHLINLKTPEELEKSLNFAGICYVISTSGTLGTKKVVKVTENSIFCNIKSFIKLFNITHTDVIYFGTPLSFDPSFVELFLALTTGACLISTSKEIRNNQAKLLQILFQQENSCNSFGKSVTFMQMCPSVFTQFSAEQIDFILFKSGLKILGLGGEKFPVHIIPEQVPKTCKIYNFYGITEVSCWASIERVFYGKEISLGTPLDEILFQIETFDGTLITVSENLDKEQNYEGVLHIGSKTRLCYIDDETVYEIDKNPEDKNIFRSTGDIVNVKNGKIFYIGRENDVIKRFGHRISLLKAQELIYTSTQIGNQCIFYQNKLICFLQVHITEGSDEVKMKTIDKIRVQLIKSLKPEFMPDLIEILQKFPIKQHNGKLDKTALQQMADRLFKADTQHNMEKSIKDIFLGLWCTYLGITGTTDMQHFYVRNFWDSGGNSIGAMLLSQEYENLTKTAFNRSLLDLKLEEALSFIDHIDNTFESTKIAPSTMFKMIWKADMKACIDSSPIVCNINGRIYVAVGNFAHTFSIFDAESGQVIASINLPNVIESASLVIDQYFYVPCFDGKLHCFKLLIDNSKEINEENLQCIWTFETGAQLKNKPIFIEDKIIFGSYDGHIYSLSKEGVLLWKTMIEEPISAEIKHFSDKLYVGALKGSIFCISHLTGAVLWTYKAQNPIFTSPELSTMNGCVLFVDVPGNIYCFSLTNIADALLWILDVKTITTQQSLTTFGSMLVVNNRIFIGSQKGIINIFKFNESQCNLEESVSLNTTSSITTKPLNLTINHKDYLIVVNSMGCIYCFHVNNSQENQKCSLMLFGAHNLLNECFSSPQACTRLENRFYLGCRDNNLRCIEVNL